MSGDSSKQAQYPPPQWENQPYPHPHYRGPPPPQQGYGISPPTPGEMVSLPPPQHPQPHPNMYPPLEYNPYPPDPRAQIYHSQPAPRQRTAIACRYCRRRKIRCSGFEASDDGRCTNCQRFQQECIFTPVSSQTSAFVPAHTAYPHLRRAPPEPPGAVPRATGRIYPQGQSPPAIYGAHGQPLHPMQHPQLPTNYAMHPPVVYQGGPVYPQPPRQQHDKVILKRLRSDESFQPAPPPPAPPEEYSSHPYQGRPPASTGRRGSGEAYEYPDPTAIVPTVSPTSSVNSYQSAPFTTQGQCYPPQQQQPPPPPSQQQQVPARRNSPHSAYSYDPASGSPHGSTSSASAYTYQNPGSLHPPQVLPPTEGRTPPPARGQSQPRDGGNGNGNGGGQRGAMAVRDLLGPGQSKESGGRSSADSDMLRALNKQGPN